MAGSAGRSPHFRLEPLGKGTHAAIATEAGYGLCNSGIVDLGDLTVVFDTMLTPMAGADLCRSAERITGRRPDFVINSHWHGDHIRGTASFAPVQVISSRATRRLIARRGPAQLAWDLANFPRELARLDGPSSRIPKSDRGMFRGWFGGVLAAGRGVRLVLPDVTFDTELTLEGSRRSLSILTYGGGHSPSDVFAFLPDERIAFLGDLVNVGMHPSVSDGYPDRWREILRNVRALRPAAVVPGHGEVGTARAILKVETYLGDLIRLARSLRPGERLTELSLPPAYRDWKFAAFFLENLRRTRRLLG